MLPGAVLLLVDSIFSWQRECFDIPGFGAHCVGHNAWTGHGAIPGALMGGFAMLLVIWEVLMLIGVPAPPAVPAALGSAVLSFATAGFGVVKFLIVAAYGPFAFAFAGLVLALAIAFGGYLRATAAAASSSPPGEPPP